MLPRHHPGRVQITFDGHRLAANAGLILPATLALRLGLPQLLRKCLRKRLDLGDAPGRANTGGKLMTLAASALAGGDCIGGTARVPGFTAKAPSTPGAFLRRFRRGHVRQPDRVSRELPARAWAAGDGPGGAPFTIGLDPAVCETCGLAKEGARRHGCTGARGYHPLPAIAAGTGGAVPMSRLGEGRARGQLTVRADSSFYTHAVVALCRNLKVRFSIIIGQHASLRNLIEEIPGEDWTPVPCRMDGAAAVAETTCTPFRSEPGAAPVRLTVRRVKPTPGSQLALFAACSYHGFITGRDGDTLELEAGHRRHAETGNAIRDLKHGVGLNHMPSGRFAANAARLAVPVMAHNLARWTARTGPGERTVTAKTLRRRFFSRAGRLTRPARRLTLHLPQRWPRQEKVTRAPARLRAIPLPA